MEEISYVFSFTAAHFLLALVDASISHFVTAATKFSCSYNKKMSPLFFISRSRSLSPFLSLSFAGLPLFLSLFHALYSKFVDMTIKLSLILQKTRIQKQFSLPVSSLLNLQLPQLYKTRVAMRFPAKIISSCIWVAMPVD